MIKSALEYLSMGLSIIPLSPGAKIPPKGLEVIPYRSRLATKDEVEAWWGFNKFYNMAIITGKRNNLFVVDLDKHDPAYSEDIFLEYFPESLEVPTVSTPKGGLHLYFSYPENLDITIGARTLPGIDFRGEGGYIVAPPSVNGNGKSYKWIVPFNASLLVPPPAAYINKIISILRESRSDVVNHVVSTTKDYTDYKILQKGRRDEDLFTVANALIKNKVNTSFTEQVLEILVKNCNPPEDEKVARQKVSSAIARVSAKERNLALEVKEWCMLQEGYFSTTDILQTLQITTKEEKKNLTVILTRLNKEGIIQKYGEKRGQYMTPKVEEDNVIDIDTVDSTFLPIKLTMGISELVRIMPKNIIVVAGEPNSGKSAFLLNTAAKNIDNEDLMKSLPDKGQYYFSSEMGGAELKVRLHNFDEKMPFNKWKKITFIERANDFDLVIRPNAVNYIDFLEMHDDFYKIGGFIKRIFDKLDKGIAIIAIQKNPGRDEGLGGSRSLEKARLYLSLAPGVLKIVKAKNWVSSLMNPNGLIKEFKLVKGIIIKESSPWELEKEVTNKYKK